MVWTPCGEAWLIELKMVLDRLFVICDAPCERPRERGGMSTSSFAESNASIFNYSSDNIPSTLRNTDLTNCLLGLRDLIVYVINLSFQIKLV